MSAPTLDPEQRAADLESRIRSELWISFVSLLRSHLAALQVSGRLAQAVFATTGPGGLEIADMMRTLHISTAVAHGTGTWRLTRLSVEMARGEWILYPDATISIDGRTPQDLDLAVEEFARKLSSRAERN